jgi:hypothetical protein
MCTDCDEIDDQIARYRGLQGRINDQQTETAIMRLIVDLETKKASLHPEQE